MWNYFKKELDNRISHFVPKTQNLKDTLIKHIQVYNGLLLFKTSSSTIAERPCDARVTSIREIVKWNF